jgi:hypothetical protein
MKRLTLIAVLTLIACAANAGSASAAFELSDLDVSFLNADGTPATQAGSHPYEMQTTIAIETEETALGRVPGGEVRDLTIGQIPGFVGNQTAMPTCSLEDFNTREESRPACSDATAVGYSGVEVEFNTIPADQAGQLFHVPVYNLDPSPGSAATLGFVVLNVPITIDVGVSETQPYNLVATLHNIPQALLLYRSEVTLWGNPASPAHDSLRGNCLGEIAKPSTGPISLGNCPVNIGSTAFLTLPRACAGPLTTFFSGLSWESEAASGSAGTHDGSVPPSPVGMTGCSKLDFAPTISAQPTTKAAASPTGLDFSLDVEDEGLENSAGIAAADIAKAVVTLPEGFSTNPSVAEGLNVCTEADLAREAAASAPGAGCPDASKIGTVEVETQLLKQPLIGSLFIAEPYENPTGSLIALYIVIKDPKSGISIMQPLKVEPDPNTGQLRTVAEDLPQLPFSHFKLHFREGTRSPLASPPACGEYAATAELTPSSGAAPIVTDSMFSIISGPSSGPCPSGTPPFRPGLVAGTVNNAAGSYSPFNLRLSRLDGEQEFTHFSIKLPPGIVGKLAGIPFCPDASIAVAKARTGPHGGQEELGNPSCPAASEVGRTLVGAGVGPSLAWAPGKVYLAGPYNGSALSIAAITAAKVGPFDLGTVVVREALKINPETAEVFVDATGSDPIPHIIDGVPVHARDIRVYVDRPGFMLNPTNCTRTSTASTVLGSGLDFGSEGDDQPITVTSPFQAADCASLGFAPKLRLWLLGGSKRTQNPRLKAVLTARPGDANIAEAQVTLSHSQFLDNAHIGTVCTRVQFAQGAHPGERCPPASIYGYARAITPILDDPVQGPVFLRSSNHNLPDLVAALHNGQIDFNLVGRIDSVKGGRIRNTFEMVPDVPVTRFTLTMQGGKKGLLVNSTNLCAHKSRAIASFTGQNGKVHEFSPVLKPQCRGEGARGRDHRRKG